MTNLELTVAVLEIQALSKMLLVYHSRKNCPFCISTVDQIKEVVKKIEDDCVVRTELKFYLAK